MKRLAVIFLFLIGCSKPEEAIQFNIEPQLQFYYSEFLTEAAIRNFPIESPRANLIVKFSNVLSPEFGMNETTFGQRTVYIDFKFFKSHPELREFLLFHQFGHLFIGRYDNPGQQSIMNRDSIVKANWPCLASDNCATKRTELITELFHY